MIASDFDPDQLRIQLHPLDLTHPLASSPLEKAYFKHYQLQFTQVGHLIGKIKSTGFDIACQYFKPIHPVGTLFIIHGYYDHVGLYRHVIEFGLKHRLNVIAYDLPGHGLSSGPRASIDQFSDYVAVFKAVIQFFQADTPKPFYLCAQSTGGAIAMDYYLSNSIQRANSIFSKVALFAPLIRPQNWEFANVSYILAKRFIKERQRMFEENSGDSSFMHFLQAKDPLQTRVLPLTWVGALSRWIDYFEALPGTDMPLCLLQGRADSTVDFAHNLPIICEKFKASKIYFFDRAQHQLVNETAAIREKLFTTVADYFFKV